MKTENNSVQDGKLTDEQLGKLQRKLGEIKRRIDEGTISYQDTIDVMQGIIIENKLPLHLGVLRGTHEIKAIEHVIDLGGSPFIPDGWKVEKHEGSGVVRLEKRADGQLYINGKKVVLYLSKKQMNGKTVVGNELREEVSGKEILSTIVLDYLLAHPELIPEDWKKDKKGNTRYICFWRTIYRSSRGDLCVSGLCAGVAVRGAGAAAGLATALVRSTPLLSPQVSTLLLNTVVLFEPLTFVLCSRKKVLRFLQRPLYGNTVVLFLC